MESPRLEVMEDYIRQWKWRGMKRSDEKSLVINWVWARESLRAAPRGLTQ